MPSIFGEPTIWGSRYEWVLGWRSKRYRIDFLHWTRRLSNCDDSKSNSSTPYKLQHCELKSLDLAMKSSWWNILKILFVLIAIPLIISSKIISSLMLLMQLPMCTPVFTHSRGVPPNNSCASKFSMELNIITWLDSGHG